MKVNVYVDKKDIKEIMDIKDIKDIVKRLNINLEEFIIVRNGELINEDAKLKDKDRIKFLSVISGG